MVRNRAAVLVAGVALLAGYASGTTRLGRGTFAESYVAQTCLAIVPTNGAAPSCSDQPLAALPSGPASSEPDDPTSTVPPPPWTGTSAEKRFAWAEDGYLTGGATVTLVRGTTPRTALRIVTSGLRHGRIASASSGPLASPASATQVRAGALPGGWTLVVEDNGFEATDHAILRRLSAAGEAVVIFTNVNADESFQYAVGGRVRREFDPLIFGRPWIGAPLREERGIRFGDERDLHPMAQSFLLAYRLTGVALTERNLMTTRGRLAVDVDY